MSEVDVADLVGDDPEEDLSHPILSPEQVKEARAKARDKVTAARTKAAMQALMDEETLRLEREEGFTTGAAVNDEVVRMTLDLAPFQRSANGGCGLTVNFKTYEHGVTYTVPRHVANSLREMQANGWRHEATVKGKSLSDYYQRAEEAKISGVFGVQSRFQAHRQARAVEAA